MENIQGRNGAYLYPNQINQASHVNDTNKLGTSNDHEVAHKKSQHHMQAIAQLFNTRLEYRYNEILKQVVVKIYDDETDTLIKELPSAEVQAVYTRIREVLGQILDQNA